MKTADEIKALLDEMRAVEEAATKGPWKYNDGHRMAISQDSIHEDPVLWGDEFELSDLDATFIARSRTDNPRLRRALEVALDTLLELTLGTLADVRAKRASDKILTILKGEQP